jgi:PKD repeat protein
MIRRAHRPLAGATSLLMIAAGAVVVTATVAVASQLSDPGPVNQLPNPVPSAVTPAVNDGRVFAIAQNGSKMIMGGSFTSVGGVAHTSVAAFDKTTGALSSAFSPTVNGDVNSVLPGPTATTVYIGGAFTQVNGVAAQFLAELDVNTGALVSSFKPPAFNFGFVNDMVARGNRLYVAGTFTIAGGKKHAGLVSLNATTGALDPFVNVQFTGHHNDSGSGAQGWVGPWDIDATADGRTMVVIGNFKLADGLLRDQVAVLDLSGTTAQVANWATSRYSPLCFNFAFDSYVRGVSFSPDGSYFVVNATGGGNPGTLCDSTARFETNLADSNAQPTWVDETGGDTVWGITVTNTAVYIGGHNRWNNNPQGVDVAQPGAVPRPGLAALDPVSGRPFSWNPGRKPLGVAVFAVYASADGLWIGSNTDWIGNFQYKRPKIAFFPYAGGPKPTLPTTATLPGTVYLAGSKGTGQTNVLYRVDAGGPAIQSFDAGPDWAADNSDPSTVRNSGSNAATWTGGETVDATVPASTPRTIFESERWSPSDNPAMNWAFPVASGTPLQVRLYFANRCTCTSGIGQRVFNVAIDNRTVLSRYDIVADVGDQRGTMKAFNIVSDGIVNIDFSHVVENPLINGIEIVRTDVPAPPPSGADTLRTVAFDGTNAVATDAANQGIDFGNWRGAFLVSNKVFYGYIDGNLYERSFDGSTFGGATKIDPYNDPVWSDVDTDDGTTFRGLVPTLYGQMPNVTGMVYSGGRLYYTLFNDPNLYSRWFSADSGIVDETTATAPTTVDFSNADGMFVSGGNLYYGSRTDGNLRRVPFAGGAVTGVPTVVSGPLLGGINWSNRAMFLTSAPANVAPTAAFGSSCTGLTCSFDASASSDSDGTIATYTWDFGDGTSGTGKAPSHTYTAGGTFSVKLTVTDNDGATDSVTHSVAPVPVVAGVKFVAAANAGGGNAKTKTVSIPAAAAAGNTALLFLSGTSTATWTGPTGVTGWTQVGTFSNSTLVTTVWRKTLSAADAGAALSFTSATASHASVDVAVYSGVDTTAPIARFAQGLDTAKASHTTPAVTADAGDLIVSFWGDRSTATRTWTVPAASATLRDASPDSGTLTVQAVIADSNGPVPAGARSGVTATTDANTDRTAMWTIELRAG